ncbi:phosphoglycerate mutase, partial [Amycolatopsis sp. NPDC049252]
VRYTETRPFVLRVNDHSADLSGIVPPAPKPSKRGKKAAKDATSSDAVVGGTTGR